MRVFSLFLLLSGWFLVAAAIALLKPNFVPVFAGAGLGVELLGLALLARAQAAALRLPRRERGY